MKAVVAIAVLLTLPVLCRAQSYQTAASPVQVYGPVTTQQVGGTLGGTANTFVVILPANVSHQRRSCAIYNNSTGTEYVYIGTAATPAVVNSVPIAAGGSFICNSPGGVVPQDQISLAASIASATYVLVTQ